MRRTKQIVRCLLIASLMLGCTAQKPTPATAGKRTETAKASPSTAMADANQLTRAMRDMADDQASKFADQMNKDLTEMQDEMKRLSAKVDDSGNAIDADARATLSGVSTKLDQAKQERKEAKLQAKAATQAIQRDAEALKNNQIETQKELQRLSDRVERSTDAIKVDETAKLKATRRELERTKHERDQARTSRQLNALTTRDNTYMNHVEFVETMKRRMLELEKEIDRLSVQVDRSNYATRADAMVKLSVVRDRWTQTKKKLDDHLTKVRTQPSQGPRSAYP